MMKRMQRIAVLAMTVCLILGTMAVSVFAADGYEYKMTVSGGRGSIKGVPNKLTSAEPVTTNPDVNKIKINGEEKEVTPPDPDHFVIGLKKAGHDNNNGAGGLLDKAIVLAEENEDVDLVVAYGLKSNMVPYTINYVNAAGGASLLPSETHYGVDGAKPVVAYKYVENYLPQAYNLTGTITKGGANVFTF